MAAADRLSALTDDLLQHSLSFAPAREAAASAILSRRWRPLWPRTGAVNLDSRPYAAATDQSRYYHRPTFNAFFRDALAALAAFHPRRGGRRRHRRRGGTGHKRLTLLLNQGVYHRANPYYRTDVDAEEEGDNRVSGVLLADPAAAGLEELRIENKGNSCFRTYGPRLAALPCAATLRVLELTSCKLEPSPAAPSAGLTDLRLCSCVVSEGYLQVVIDVAPALTSLVLENVFHEAAEPAGSARKPYHMATYFTMSSALCGTLKEIKSVTGLIPEIKIQKNSRESNDTAHGLALFSRRELSSGVLHCLVPSCMSKLVVACL